MTKEQIASILNGREYGSEFTETERLQLHDSAGCIIAYGTGSNLPHATFDTMQNGQFYCHGLVVDMRQQIENISTPGYSI